MKAALLLVGHGSTDPGADDVLPYYVDRLSRTGLFSEVVACCLERSPSIREALGDIRADRVYLMPLLVARGYHTRVTIPEAIEAAGKEVVLLEPLGRSEHIVRLIGERARAAILESAECTEAKEKRAGRRGTSEPPSP